MNSSRQWRVLFGAFWLLVGLLSSWKGFSVNYFLKNARFTQATVLAKWSRYVSGRSSFSRGVGSTQGHTEYYVNYRFSTQAGQVVVGTDKTFDLAVWKSMSKGATVAVLYLPQKPSENQLAFSRTSLDVSLYWTFGGLLSVWGAFILLKVWRQQHRDAYLLSEGAEGRGTVQKVLAISPAWPMNKIYYSYEDDAGTLRQSRAEGLSGEKVHGWQVGDVGRIRFNPESPKQVVWVGEKLAVAPEARVAVEGAEIAPPAKRHPGVRAFLTGLLLVAIGAQLIYFFVVPHWGKTGLRPEDTTAVLAASVALGVLLFGIPLTFFGGLVAVFGWLFGRR